MSKKNKQKSQHEPQTEENAAQPVEPIEASDEAEQLAKEFQELKDRYQRLGADYANYQRRMEKQLEQVRQFSKDDFLKSMLPVLDNFQHTLEKGGGFDNAAAVLQGVQIVYDHLMNILNSQGLQKLVVNTGDPFDPSKHEAMLHQETDEVPANTVLAELATGYVVGDRPLRPAKVSIAKAPAPAPEPESDNPAESDDNVDEQE